MKTKFKKIITATLAGMLIVSSLGIFPGSAFAEDTTPKDSYLIYSEDKNRIEDVSDDSRQLFSKLFFENNDAVEKIIGYFDANSDADKNIYIDEIIESLALDTNREETFCIIENLYFIDDYVESDKIKDATEGRNLLDNVGGIFSEQKKLSFVPQLLWKKDTFHNDKTTSIAKSYFSDTVAAKIGKYNREVDVKYSSGKGAIGLGDRENQYIHFNQYATGSNDSRDEVASLWFVSSELAWKKGQKDNAYKYLGYALHPLQDKEAHGQIGRGQKIPSHISPIGNVNKADTETGWEWTDSNRNKLKSVAGSKKRYNAAVSVTKTWLAKYKTILTDKNFNTMKG